MSDINESIRKQISARANLACEYCLIHEDDTYFGCQIDHIISIKHGGSNEVDNLAYSYVFCNRHKGSDIGSIILNSDRFIRFYNPRLDQWNQHFQLNGSVIEPITDIGEVTVKILKMNHIDRILERNLLIQLNRYPILPK